jgi:hypothetical protein
MLNDYLKAVPELTITEEWKLAHESEARARQRDDSTKNLIASLTTQNQELREQVKVLAERLTKTESIQAEAKKKQRRTDEIMNKLFKDSEFRQAVKETLLRQR